MLNITELKSSHCLSDKFNSIKLKRKSFDNTIKYFSSPVKNIDKIIEYAKYYHQYIFNKNIINKNILYIFLTDLQFNNKNTPIIKVGYTSKLEKRYKDLKKTFKCNLILLKYYTCEGEFEEKQIHMSLELNFPNLAIKSKDKYGKEHKELYFLNDIIMKTIPNLLSNNLEILKERTRQEEEKTKQIISIEKTKQEEEKTKQEEEKTRQEEEKTKQEEEKTKQEQIKLEILKIKNYTNT